MSSRFITAGLEMCILELAHGENMLLRVRTE